MKYKIIALDVDGTLVTSDGVLAERDKNALIRIQEESGMRIILASGRPPQGLKALANDLKLDEYSGYILPFNGGQVINCRTKKVISENTLSKEVVAELYEMSKEHGLTILTYGSKGIISENPEDPFLQEEARLNQMDVIRVENFLEAVNFNPPKCLLVGPPERVKEVEGLFKLDLQGKVNVFRSAEFFLELVPWGVHKAQAIAGLLDKLDLNRNELIAVGDSFNDVEMIQYAGLGVAMANAKEPVKACADYVTTDNDNAGIAHMLDKYVFNDFDECPYTPEQVNEIVPGTLMDSLGIRCTVLGKGYVEATMPVDIRTRQPMGILHGGANLAFAETIAGFGSLVLLEPGEIQVGMQVSGNHIASALEGDIMRAEARIIHQGRSTHVWSVEIFSTKSGKLICSVRVLNSILKKR
ncbi:Cof-type HAD-IIB family hydrolase [Porphyromonas pogonae]|uniref:Cof-type HAD-IIB family hydrolase n=1 Tax=Porphyromonas pogonae TaxID=867595 RepID=UPI002E765908|nr:Cof-type HAD-IIB family hydrolase [Porphyromonas pogonae]